MSGAKKSAKLIRAYIRTLGDAGVLEPGQTVAMDKAGRKIWNGVQHRDWKAVEAGITELCRAFRRNRP